MYMSRQRKVQAVTARGLAGRSWWHRQPIAFSGVDEDRTYITWASNHPRLLGSWVHALGVGSEQGQGLDRR